MTRTIVFAGGGTGGHLMPALALAGAVSALEPDWRFVFAGAERGIEATVLPQRGVPHELLPLLPIHRRQWWKNAAWIPALPRLLRRIDQLLDRERPAAVIGTGGYVSGPVVWRAALRGIPTGILELDVKPGIATRGLARRVDEIWLAAPEALAALPAAVQSKALVTGAPIVPPCASRQDAAREKFGVQDGVPVVVVTGGSQGSLAINQVIAEWIVDGGAADLQLIWATGRSTHARFASLHAPPAVQVLPFVDPMADAWSVADLCVARSGMMTLAELCAWGIPSILVPLPTSAANHQLHNARALERAGAAQVIEQRDLDARMLSTRVHEWLGNRVSLSHAADAARARGRPGAAAEIAERVRGLVTRGVGRRSNDR